MDEKTGLNLKTLNKQVVEEVKWGMYVWENEDGKVVVDSDYNVMNVFCIKGDRKAIDAITQAAKYYGQTGGKPVWWSGKRRITDEELQEQKTRQTLGLVPDPQDVAAIRDQERANRK